MRSSRLYVLFLLVSLLLAPAAGALEVGEPAPDTVLHGTDGALYPLSEHRGKQGVVLAWFPKAFTPG